MQICKLGCIKVTPWTCCLAARVPEWWYMACIVMPLMQGPAGWTCTATWAGDSIPSTTQQPPPGLTENDKPGGGCGRRRAEQLGALWFASGICMSFSRCLWNVQNDNVCKRPADSAWKMGKPPFRDPLCPASLHFLYLFLRFLLMQTFAWRQNLCFLKSSSAPAAYWPCHASAQQNLLLRFQQSCLWTAYWGLLPVLCASILSKREKENSSWEWKRIWTFLLFTSWMLKWQVAPKFVEELVIASNAFFFSLYLEHNEALNNNKRNKQALE